MNIVPALRGSVTIACTAPETVPLGGASPLWMMLVGPKLGEGPCGTKVWAAAAVQRTATTSPQASALAHRRPLPIAMKHGTAAMVPWRPQAGWTFSVPVSVLVAILEVAVAGALHDGLGALELELGVVALAERAVAVARQQMADLAQTHRLVGLGVAALHDVELERRVALLLDLDLERAALGPERHHVLEGFQRRPARRGLGELTGLFNG